MDFMKLMLDTTAADRHLLQRNQQLGDNPEISRDLDFVLNASTGERARLVHDYLTDIGFGSPSVEQVPLDDGSVFWRLTVSIHAPAREDVVFWLSGFAECLATIHDLTYDGWGCVIQKGE